MLKEHQEVVELYEKALHLTFGLAFHVELTIGTYPINWKSRVKDTPQGGRQVLTGLKIIALEFAQAMTIVETLKYNGFEVSDITHGENGGSYQIHASLRYWVVNKEGKTVLQATTQAEAYRS